MTSIRSKIALSLRSCLALVVACTVGCGLFLANRILVASVYVLVVPDSSAEASKIRMFLLLLVPIALLVPEWWMLDTVRQAFRSWAGKQS